MIKNFNHIKPLIDLEKVRLTCDGLVLNSETGPHLNSGCLLYFIVSGNVANLSGVVVYDKIWAKTPSVSIIVALNCSGNTGSTCNISCMLCMKRGQNVSLEG